ncbi:MFS general substrate transporter [Amylocystis lapponica]|nr:MFS general substrate transporter [Amylocystis lapponica]
MVAKEEPVKLRSGASVSGTWPAEPVVAKVEGDVEDAQQDAASESFDDADYKKRFPHIDEAKVVQKIDWHLLPVLCILYVLAFLDRVNISNATLFGLEEDLSLEGNQYNTALVIFFVPYIVFEFASNALLKHFKPHVWLSLCMCLFGLVTILQGLTKSFSGLVATRFFLGLLESGVFPGSFYLIAMWYKRAEAQKRYSFYFSSTTLAGAFGGLLASAIGKMDGMRGYRGWRWLFILEGTMTCVVSALFYFVISDFPEEATWLTDEEREFVKARLYADVGHSKRSDPLTLKGVLNVLMDYKIIAGGFMYFGLIVPGYGYAPLRPSMGMCLALAMIVGTVSDLFRHRFIFVLIPTAIAIAGFIILLAVHDNTKVQYAALFLSAMGVYAAEPIMICWFNTNHAIWIVHVLVVGAIIAIYAFLAKDAPRYTTGYGICIAFICISVVADFVYLWGLVSENMRRNQCALAYTHDEDVLTAEQKKGMGDLNPDYRYIL